MATLDTRRLFSGPLQRFGPILALNMIPVAGVLWLGWDAGQILILYWIENVVVGLLAVVRILTAQDRSSAPQDARASARLRLGCFFILHYGLFTLVHGVFTLVLAAKLMGGGGALWRGAFGSDAFHWAVLTMAGLQLAIMVRDWWMSGLWRRSSPAEEMFRPYGRIVVLHVTILAGAWGLSAVSAPVWAVVILCLMKAALELTLAMLFTPDRD